MVFGSSLKKGHIKQDDFIADLAEQYDIDIAKNARAKNLSLRVNAKTGRVRLTIPIKIQPQRIAVFLEQYQSWIIKHQDQFDARVPFVEGAFVPYRGRYYHIVQQSGSRTNVTFKDDQMIVTTRGSVRVNTAVMRFSDLSYQKAALIGKKIQQIDILDTISRWGSCSVDGRLMYSWRIIMAPDAAIDYLISHEVSHLMHMNHSPAFWTLCQSLCIDYEYGKDWIKRQGKGLFLFGS
jgi:predicted metal-dependent hydrolase